MIRDRQTRTTMQPRNEAPITRTQACGEDTVEIELTAQEQLALSQAAEATRALAPAAASPNGSLGAARDNCLWERTARIDFVSTATFAALVLAVAGALLWHSTGFDARTTAAATATATATPSASAHASPAPAKAPKPPPLQVLNPFDPKEVFELPAETTESEAREAVADLLLQRARSRLAETAGPKHTSVRHRVADVEHQQAEIFVTRLSASAN
jgi:hypothetical protein